MRQLEVHRVDCDEEFHTDAHATQSVSVSTDPQTVSLNAPLRVSVSTDPQ